MPRKKRSRGERNPIGETKLAILFYLNDGEKKRTEIIDFLRKKYNIREQRTIDQHLTGLLNEGVIVKEKIGRGLPISYHLANGFNGFKTVFKYMRKNNKELELLKLPYTENEINEDIFPNLTEDLLLAIVSPIISLMVLPEEEIEKDESFSHIYNTIMRNDFTKKLFEERKTEFQKNVENNRVTTEYKEYKPSITNSSEIITSESTSTYIIPGNEDLLEWLSKLLFPLNEREEILNILRCSPSASSFITTLSDISINNAIMLLSSYFEYYLQDIFSLMIKINKEGIENFSIEEEIKNLLITQDKKSTTPILCLLRGHLNTDILSLKVIENEWVGKYRKSLFIENEADLQQFYTEINGSNGE